MTTGGDNGFFVGLIYGQFGVGLVVVFRFAGHYLGVVAAAPDAS